MKDTITNTEAKKLIDKAYNEDGSPTRPESKHYQREAQAIFNTGYDGYGEYYKGFDVCVALQILANPGKDI
jgi:hypothetical protein